MPRKQRKWCDRFQRSLLGPRRPLGAGVAFCGFSGPINVQEVRTNRGGSRPSKRLPLPEKPKVGPNRVVLGSRGPEISCAVLAHGCLEGRVVPSE